ncbi:MAG: acyltransferase [Akkermansia muciniphila]|nr:acyltransferase [Akkermansia muciniphila]
MPTENRQRLVWVDALRFAAIFLVILSHSCDPLTANPDPAVSSDSSLGFRGACWQSLTRPGVPLFVCMTGLLLLLPRHRHGSGNSHPLLRSGGSTLPLPV